MRTPENLAQPVLAPLTESALFMTLTIGTGGEAAVHDLLPDLAGMVRSVGFPLPDEHLTCVAGIGSAAWDRLFTGERPALLHPFRALSGSRHQAPSTPGDLFLHIRATRLYPCFELARRVAARLDTAVSVQDDTVGFRYFDRRDLLGYVDGTENPVGHAAGVAALVADEDPGFTGGSYLIVQKYLHDLAKWTAKPVEERDRAVGRHLADDVEIPDAEKAVDSHVALTTIEGPDGTEGKILRDNMPFGSIARDEYGTYFCGYAADPGVTERMLTRMFLAEQPDQLLDVSTAVTGGLYFVPPAGFLADPPALPAGRG
ncbi:Dyp-type peroxidase [Amycolatopsis sp. WAC 04182]|uniref:Dyp-type peroxidase n=1 Tax=Amycolatopsis sp. WAC 04182 TaxID=2203198 RepID=UPI001F1B7B3D|nr:Dyp-type peroxidase [Amycolatopsis sp. WAC 04182]